MPELILNHSTLDALSQRSCPLLRIHGHTREEGRVRALLERVDSTSPHISQRDLIYARVLTSAQLADSFTYIHGSNQNCSELIMPKLAKFASELARQADISSPCHLKPISMRESRAVSPGALLFAGNNVLLGLNGQHKD